MDPTHQCTHDRSFRTISFRDGVEEGLDAAEQLAGGGGEARDEAGARARVWGSPGGGGGRARPLEEEEAGWWWSSIGKAVAGVA